MKSRNTKSNPRAVVLLLRSGLRVLHFCVFDLRGVQHSKARINQALLQLENTDFQMSEEPSHYKNFLLVYLPVRRLNNFYAMFLLKIKYMDSFLDKHFGQISKPYLTKWRPNSVLQQNECLNISYFRTARYDKIYVKMPCGN